MNSYSKLNWFYLFIAVLGISMLFISLRYFRGSKYSSVGIAQAREYKISAERPALIKAIHVVPGQQVRTGDLLVEMVSNEFEINLEKLSNRISALKSEQSEKAKLAASAIAFIKAEQGVLVDKMNSEILQAESEQKLNERLSKRFDGNADTIGGEHPVQVKLRALRQQRGKQEEAIAIKVKDILQQQETEQKLLVNQIGLLEKEMAQLLAEKKRLIKYASADGIVGMIFVRQGEQVDSYASLLSIQPIHPATVVGYMVGKKDIPPVGAQVSVQSFDSSEVINGKVIGYGGVVELPGILQKSTAVKSFGKEVFIEIPVQNQLASGEKVLIR